MIECCYDEFVIDILLVVVVDNEVGVIVLLIV